MRTHGTEDTEGDYDHEDWYDDEPGGRPRYAGRWPWRASAQLRTASQNTEVVRGDLRTATWANVSPNARRADLAQPTSCDRTHRSSRAGQDRYGRSPAYLGRPPTWPLRRPLRSPRSRCFSTASGRPSHGPRSALASTNASTRTACATHWRSTWPRAEPAQESSNASSATAPWPSPTGTLTTSCPPR